MTRTGAINAAGAILAVIVALVAATVDGSRPSIAVVSVKAPGSASELYVKTEDGRPGVVDATGAVIAVEPYGRIVSGSTAVDWLLTELAAPDRVLAYTGQSAERAPWRHRFAGKKTIDSLSSIEALLAMHPDLVITDDFGDPKRIARLREHGLAVFDIGELRGVDALVLAAQRLGALLGHPDRGDVLASRFGRSMRAIAMDLPEAGRRTAIYVSVYGDKLYGGTVGTTYHEILRYAGLVDAAAGRHRNWPEYTIEELLVLDPELIVTRPGMGQMLCRLPGLDRLRACTTAHAIIELDGFVLDDPGLGMLEAAEALHRAVHGTGRPNRPPSQQ